MAIADVMMSTNFMTFASFFWYVEVSTLATALMLAPARDITPNGILMMKVLRVATLDIPEAMLGLLKQAFSHINQPNILEYLEYFFAYLSSSFNNPCRLFWIRLDGRIEVPKELMVPLGDLDMCYSSSSFYKDILENDRH